MSTMLQEGVQLLILGMGTVFVFLVVLIFGTSLMSAVVGRFKVPETPVPNGPGARNGGRAGSQPDAVAAVAAAAYAAHRRSR